MGLPARQAAMTPSDFLAWEAGQGQRHEFFDGEVFAMAGAEDRHVTVSGNLYMALRQHLAGSPFRSFMADMKLQAGTDVFYPDVLVTCSEADRRSALVKRDALLVAEVLSPSTAGFDRGEKFARYRRIASLREYLLVDLDSRATDLFRRRDEDGLWVLHPFAAGEDVVLASVGLTIPAAQLFAEVDDPAAEAPPADG